MASQLLRRNSNSQFAEYNTHLPVVVTASDHGWGICPSYTGCLTCSPPTVHTGRGLLALCSSASLGVGEWSLSLPWEKRLGVVMHCALH